MKYNDASQVTLLDKFVKARKDATEEIDDAATRYPITLSIKK